MLWLEQDSYSAPFPRIPDSIIAKYSISDLSIRPFGVFEKDLEICFKEKSRPYLVTRILQCCTDDITGNPPESDFFLDLTVGKRIECLLTLATLGGSSLLNFSTPCLNRACNQEMEIQISVDELVALEHQYDDSDSFIIRVADESMIVRKPKGYDQLEWLKNSYGDEDEVIKEVLKTLLSRNEKSIRDRGLLFPDEWVQIINDSMDEFDPLVNFNLMVYCPYCGNERLYDIDLEEISLQRLQEAQVSLLRSIHCLAKHYHWNEKQFFSIPPWRRSHYLALIEKEENS